MKKTHKMDLTGFGIFITCILSIMYYPTTFNVAIVSFLLICGLTSRFLLFFHRITLPSSLDLAHLGETVTLKKYFLLRVMGTFFAWLIMLISLYFLFRIPAYLTAQTTKDLYQLYQILSSLTLSPQEKSETLHLIREIMGIPSHGSSFPVHVKFFLFYLLSALIFRFSYSSILFPFTKRLGSALLFTLIVFILYMVITIIAREVPLKKSSPTLRKTHGNSNLPGVSLTASLFWVIPFFLWLGMIILNVFIKLPGMGQLLLQVSTGPHTDYIATQIVVSFMGLLLLIINLITDMAFVSLRLQHLKRHTRKYWV